MRWNVHGINNLLMAVPIATALRRCLKVMLSTTEPQPCHGSLSNTQRDAVSQPGLALLAPHELHGDVANS